MQAFILLFSGQPYHGAYISSCKFQFRSSAWYNVISSHSWLVFLRTFCSGLFWHSNFALSFSYYILDARHSHLVFLVRGYVFQQTLTVPHFHGLTLLLRWFNFLLTYSGQITMLCWYHLVKCGCHLKSLVQISFCFLITFLTDLTSKYEPHFF